MHKGTYIWENLNAMESKYHYFKRDISWLSFNYRVLLEANDDRLPLYERINFISIYSSNLEEFYKIRVADHKAVASGVTLSDEESVQSANELVENINREVNRQLEDRIRIYEHKIIPALRKNHIIFYQSRNVEPFHRDFIKNFFREEIFPLPPTGAGMQRSRRVILAGQPALSRGTSLHARHGEDRPGSCAIFRNEITLQ